MGSNISKAVAEVAIAAFSFMLAFFNKITGGKRRQKVGRGTKDGEKADWDKAKGLMQNENED